MAVATAKKMTNGKPGPKHNIEAVREAYYQRIAKRDMAPLWKVMGSVVTKEPVTRCQPHVWHYDDVKSLVMESGGLITAEVPPPHRHVSPAIRFVLDGEGAYTAVDGEKAYMAPGDFVITANWAPHDHGNNSKKPMLWLDVLDFPAVNFFEASFAEYSDEQTQSTTRQDGDSLTFYGSGVLPDGAWSKSYTPEP